MVKTSTHITADLRRALQRGGVRVPCDQIVLELGFGVFRSLRLVHFFFLDDKRLYFGILVLQTGAAVLDDAFVAQCSSDANYEEKNDDRKDD